MIIYKIFAVNKNGEKEVISPMLCNTNEKEMVDIAKRMKYDMKKYYIKVELRCDTYEYKSSSFIDI